MDNSYQHSLGYSTRDALIKLRDDIRAVIDEHKRMNPIRLSIVKNIISFSSEKVLLSGVAYTITLVYIICLILTYILGESAQAHTYLLWEALFLFTILVANFAVALNEEFLYINEIPYRVEKVLETLETAIDTSVWKKEHYPHLCAPFSPCVILQWTYRDGEIVNLPWALLVEGDVVVLRPGQDVPGHCRPLHPTHPSDHSSQNGHLTAGHMFRPGEQQKEHITSPRVRQPHENKAYVMCETPYLRNLRLALTKAGCRPNTVFEKQRYLCTVKVMEGMALPLVIAVSLLAISVGRVLGLCGGAHWSEVFLLQTMGASIPLLQIVYPITWVALNCYGLARFKVVSESRQKYARPKSCSLSEDASDPLISALRLSSGSVQAQGDGVRTVRQTFVRILTGREDMLCRTANIVHVLGTLSALCCVDKKGILSWPNPTAEKVFLLRSASTGRDSQETDPPTDQGGPDPSPPPPPPQPSTATQAEVLDLTHEQNAPFRVEWDDCGWARHLRALKPLGLAALLNTCAPAPRHLYAHFCAHLTCEASYSEDLVPVNNRRCLCELARQIGFTDPATQPYSVEECLAVFRHLQADTIRRETRFARSLQLRTRVKVPLPHMVSVLVKDHKHQLQMLTQGTADIIVDSCVDFWNGSDLVPIAPADRKKIIDFYQRSSLTAYCTAFAYKPLTRAVSPCLSNLYLELPADSRQLYEPLSQQWADAPALHFHSTDSLLFNEVPDDDVKDADGYFDMQCNQVFLGMVTMQYQAQSDMVELIERLERACIRFVHFSKENELRSRVFSEKMGLESGWNCHISLSSDDNSTNMSSSKPLSMSAPGAINLDHTTVKFDSEIKKARHSITNHAGIKLDGHRDSMATEAHGSADSVMCDDGDGDGEGDGEGDGGGGGGDCESPPDAGRSLSCLTDSTEHSAPPLNFDMSNRAKLPRGIENIRPHIEQVDNVPLLVSLFTDCTARSVQLMIQIMQDYGEVVCVMGSAANCLNMEIFMQADASIAVEPLYPVLCQKVPPYEEPQPQGDGDGVPLGPISLARSLNAVPCSLSRSQCNGQRRSVVRSPSGDVSLFALITMCRHFTVSLWNTTQFWMCSLCFLALLQTSCLCSCLPLPLSPGGVLWTSAAILPALSAALAFAPLHPSVMHRAYTRHFAISRKMALFVFWCYACKFLPALLLIVALYGLTLRSFCHQIASYTNATDCWMVYPVNKGEFTAALDLSAASWHGWADHFYDGYFLAQHIALALITLHLVVISVSFVHRHSSVWQWQRSVYCNRVWSFTLLLLIILQAVFSGTLLSGTYGVCEVWDSCKIRYYVPAALGVGYALSPIAVFALNELIKWQEIKEDARNQRRARLDFGTKLGMNSPF